MEKIEGRVLNNGLRTASFFLLLLSLFNGIANAQTIEPFSFEVEFSKDQECNTYKCRQIKEKEGCRIELNDLKCENSTIKIESCDAKYYLNLNQAVHKCLFDENSRVFPEEEVWVLFIIRFDNESVIRKNVRAKKSGQIVELLGNFEKFYQANHGEIDQQTYLSTITGCSISKITIYLFSKNNKGDYELDMDNTWEWTFNSFKTAPMIKAMLQRIIQEQEKLGGSNSNSNNGGNSLSKGTWRIQLKRVMDHPTQNLSNGKYKGQIASANIRYGLGVYWWTSDYCYWGEWKHNNHIGYAIDIASENHDVDYCPGCTFYVGNYADGGKSGKGKCYDKEGNLIYYGDFSNDHPIGIYPSKEKYSKNKFEYIEYNSGDKYIGETYNGQRHGQGIYLWKNGDAWYGPWENGNRNGYGIYLYYKGSVEYGYSKD